MVMDSMKETKKILGRKNKKKNVIQNMPVVGGALQAKLAALAASKTASV